MKKYLVAFVLSVASAVAFSMTVTTWKGTGGSWNDAANWDNGVPVQGGKAVFNQDATIEDDFALPGNLVVSVAEGKTLNLNGVISGEGTLVFGTKYNAADCGTVNLNGENTFAGNVAVSNGFVYVNTDTACGTDDGEVFIYARNKNTKLYFTDVNFRKRISMHNGKDADIGYSSFVVFNGENTIDVIKIPNTARFAVKTGTTRLKGGLQRTGNPLFIPSVSEGAKFIIEDVPVTALFYQNASKGEIVFACEGNKIDLGSGTGYHFSMPVKCGVNNCFTEDSVMCVGEQPYALLNLNGTTQTIAQLRSKISSTTYHAGSITSHVGGLLKVVGNFDSVVSNVVRGTASFECALPEGRTATIMNKHTSSGDLVASSGTMILEENSYWAGSIAVKDGGTIRLSSAGSLSEDTVVRLEDGASFVFPGDMAFKKMYFNGEMLAPGVYSADGVGGSTVLPVISGDGKIRILQDIVPPVDAVWTGTGPDNLISTAANWQGGVAPSFSDSSLNAVFPQNNLDVEVDCNVNARGFVFSSDSQGSVVLGGENKSVSLFNSSVSVESASRAAKEVVFDTFVNLQYGCSFNVESNSALRLSGGLGALGYGVFVKHGKGSAYIHNPTNDCSLVISNGYCMVYGGQIKDLDVIVTNANKLARICMDGCTVNGKVTTKNNVDSCVPFITGSAERPSTNFINGPIASSGHLRISAGAQFGSKMYLRGGITAGNFLLLSGNSTNGSEIVFENVPFQGQPNDLYNDGNTVTMVMRTQNNYFNNDYVEVLQPSQVRGRQRSALEPDSPVLQVHFGRDRHFRDEPESAQSHLREHLYDRNADRHDRGGRRNRTSRIVGGGRLDLAEIHGNGVACDFRSKLRCDQLFAESYERRSFAFSRFPRFRRRLNMDERCERFRHRRQARSRPQRSILPENGSLSRV